MVLEDVGVEQDDQIHVDHFQSDDQNKDVEICDLVDVGEEVVEVVVEAHVVQSEPEESW